MSLVLPKTDWQMWVNYELKPGDVSDQKADILLTIFFAYHNVDLIGGRIWFGLRGGELSLQPNNATIPLEERWPQTPLLPSIETKRTITVGAASRENLKTTLGTDAEFITREAGVSLIASHGSENEKADSLGISSEFSQIEWQITCKGSDCQTIWQFESKLYNQYLCGSLRSQRLCTIFSKTRDFSIQASFNVYARDISILDASGIWPEGTGANKKGVIRALLRKFIAEAMNAELPTIKLYFP